MRVDRVAVLLMVLLGLLAMPAAAQRAGALPAKPTKNVVDAAAVLTPEEEATLDEKLENFERSTSNQIVVALYPTLPEGADLAQYSTQVMQSWGVGQKGKDNGAVLFVFVNSHRDFIATGKGLEGALPDATCKEILDTIVEPRFKADDYAGGVEAGVNAMIAATKGEYKGTGSTVRDLAIRHSDQLISWGVVLIVILFSVGRMLLRNHFGSVYASRRPTGFLSALLYAWAMRPSSSSSGGWTSSGGFFGGGGGGSWGGGGGFSGGGGSTGGGGAGGSW